MRALLLVQQSVAIPRRVSWKAEKEREREKGLMLGVSVPRHAAVRYSCTENDKCISSLAQCVGSSELGALTGATAHLGGCCFQFGD